MATNASLLAKIDTAIENLLLAIDDDAVQEYTVAGRTYKRADFGRVLDSLFKHREALQKQIAFASRSPVRLGKLGRSRPTDR